MHEIREHFWRDIGKLVNLAILEFNLQDLCTVIISHRTQDPGFDGLSVHGYHYSLTRALAG